MPLVFGRTSTGLMVPVLVDANGNVGVGPIAAGSALIGDVQARGLGWYSGAWQKAPVPFGPSGPLKILAFMTLAAGTNTLDVGAVPAGRTYVTTTYALKYYGTTAGVYIEVAIRSGGTDFFVTALGGLVNQVIQFKEGEYHLMPGDVLRTYIYGATANDVFYNWLTGYYVDLNQ